jgi:hypothetical protein
MLFMFSICSFLCFEFILYVFSIHFFGIFYIFYASSICSFRISYLFFVNFLDQFLMLFKHFGQIRLNYYGFTSLRV